MKKLLTIVMAGLFAFSVTTAQAQREPCSGKMGGIDKCVGTKFLCNNGKVSKSKLSCDKSEYGSADKATNVNRKHKNQEINNRADNNSTDKASNVNKKHKNKKQKKIKQN